MDESHEDLEQEGTLISDLGNESRCYQCGGGHSNQRNPELEAASAAKLDGQLRNSSLPLNWPDRNDDNSPMLNRGISVEVSDLDYRPRLRSGSTFNSIVQYIKPRKKTSKSDWTDIR